MFKTCFVLILACWCSLSDLMSQEVKLHTDSVLITKRDTALLVNGKKNVPPSQLNTDINQFHPIPKRAVIYSLIFPGLGQIYNRKYWKLPLIYGGFLGLTYAVTWNNRYYQDYSRAYKDIMSDTPRVNDSWVDFLRPKVTSADQVSDAQITQYRTIFKNKKNYYRRYRDLSIIGMFGLYAVCAVDAYIDAQLFDFDISDDVSVRVEPAVLPTQSKGVASGALGVNCSIKF